MDFKTFDFFVSKFNSGCFLEYKKILECLNDTHHDSFDNCKKIIKQWDICRKKKNKQNIYDINNCSNIIRFIDIIFIIKKTEMF